jgi:predicted nucleotidyltransferase
MILVQITGAPATGKTTGARFLDPKSTLFIDVDGKGLSWKGWRNDYNIENKNYIKVSSATAIYKVIKAVETMPHIKCVVIDTINTMMTNEEMEILENPSRDKWADLAVETFNIYKAIRESKRDDVVVFSLAHVENFDVNGIVHQRTMVNGKKLSKINLNSFLTYNLYTKINKHADNTLEYSLVTSSDGTTEARSVMNVFEPVIDNNLERVRQSVIEAEFN